jgi:hypothetical protein
VVQDIFRTITLINAANGRLPVEHNARYARDREPRLRVADGIDHRRRKVRGAAQ